MLVHFVHLTSCILPDSQLTSTPASSQVLPQNPRSESKFRISIASNLHHDAGFVASTYTGAIFGLHPSRIQDSTFDLGCNRCARRAIAAPSPPASSRLPTPNPSFKFGLHPSRIQDSTFDLSGNRCARSAVAFKLYTFLGNDYLYERIHLVNTLGVFTWRIHLAYSLGVFTWRIHLVRVPCARPLSRAPALVQSARRIHLAYSLGVFTWLSLGACAVR